MTAHSLLPSHPLRFVRDVTLNLAAGHLSGIVPRWLQNKGLPVPCDRFTVMSLHELVSVLALWQEQESRKTGNNPIDNAISVTESRRGNKDKYSNIIHKGLVGHWKFSH